MLSEEKGFVLAPHYSRGIVDKVMEPTTKIMVPPRVSLSKETLLKAG
jgi:hypothetical protein